MQKFKKINKERHTKPNYPIKVLDKTFSILEIIFKSDSPMNMTEISSKLEMQPSTVHRILDTLKYWGYIEQDSETKKYHLGIKFLELGMAKLQQIDLVKEATPYLKELVVLCNETVHLGVLDKGEVLYLLKEESSQTIRMISQIGRRAPLYCTALGKVLLAYMSKEERNSFLDGKIFPRLTENTIIDKEELEKELDTVRSQGFALDREENEKNVSCISAPIRNNQGKVIAALSISSPSFRVDKNTKEKLKESLIMISKKISMKLGYKTQD